MKPAADALPDQVLADIVRRLTEAYDPLAIYLCGPKAGGEAGPDSDDDLMVVMPGDAPPECLKSRLAYKRLWETGCAAEVPAWTREAFDSRRHLQGFLPPTILREGRLHSAA